MTNLNFTSIDIHSFKVKSVNMGTTQFKGSICASDKRNHGRWRARIKRMDALLSDKEAYILTLNGHTRWSGKFIYFTRHPVEVQLRYSCYL